MLPILYIADNDFKLKMLKNTKGIINQKYLNIESLTSSLLGRLTNKGRLYLVDKYDISFELTKEFEEYFQFIDLNKNYNNKINDLKVMLIDLIEHDLFIYDKYIINILRKHNIKFLYDLNVNKNKYIFNKIKEINSNIEYIYKEVDGLTLNNLHVFPNINLELRYVFNDIYNKLINDNIRPSDINIVCNEKTYYPSLYRLADSYKISLNIEENSSLISNVYIKEFYNNLLNFGLDEALKLVNDTTIYNKIVRIINDYNFDNNNLSNKKYQDILFNLLKKLNRDNIVYSDAIKVSSEPISSYNYIYYLNFNYNCPSQYEDDKYLNDDELSLLGIDNSSDKNKYNELSLLQKLNSTNYLLTYPIVIGKEVNAYSYLNSKYNINIIEEDNNIITNTLLEDSLYFTKLLDDYLLYDKFNDNLNIYDFDYLNYRKYDSSFKKFDPLYIDGHRLYNKTDKKKELSYSTFHGYFECPFRFYLDNMLELNTFNKTIHTRLGNYAHKLLECSYNKDFNYEIVKALAIEEFELEPKDIVFAEILDKTIKEVIEFNHLHESLCELHDIDCEQRIITNIDDHYKFKGFIDKVLYKIEGNIAYVAIIDYKTGNDVASLDNFKYGCNLQLPIYLYLLHHNRLFKDKEIKLVGMYLQKVRVVSQDDDNDIEFDDKNIKLKGYTNLDSTINSKLIYEDDTYLGAMCNKGGSYGAIALRSLLTDSEILMINEYTKFLINEGIKNIDEFNFAISPLHTDSSNTCKYCNYRRICFRKQKDFRKIDKKINIKSFLEELRKENEDGQVD